MEKTFYRVKGFFYPGLKVTAVTIIIELVAFGCLFVMGVLFPMNLVCSGQITKGTVKKKIKGTRVRIQKLLLML